MIRYYWSKIRDILSPKTIKNSCIDKSVWLGARCQVIESNIGYGTYLGNDTQCLYSDIGKYCSIANNCIFGGAEHPLEYVSTSPVFYGGYRNPLRIKKVGIGNLGWNPYTEHIVIGNDVWIGNNVIVKGGVKIGTGAVIGAGSVVTKDVPPYEIWAGVPARLIRKRFCDETILKLLESRWWELPIGQLQTLSGTMNDPVVFLDALADNKVQNR